jgi:hypothetical protein
VLLYGGVVDASADDNDRHYTIVGVSGGLQDGFPDRINMDYHSGQEDESKALFLGRGLVRGYKAYLDVMQEEWRQYIVSLGDELWSGVASLIQSKISHSFTRFQFLSLSLANH